MKRWIAGIAVLVVLGGVGQEEAAIAAIVQTDINPSNGHTYHLLSPSTWTDAEAEAISLGGHLATLRNAEEEMWVWNTFAGASSERLLWIGLNDVAQEGVFAWSNGEPVTYTDWYPPGEPSGGYTNGLPENYVQMGYGRQAYLSHLWNDLNDTSLHAGSPAQGVVEVPEPSAIPEPSTLIIWSLLGTLGIAVA